MREQGSCNPMSNNFVHYKGVPRDARNNYDGLSVTFCRERAELKRPPVDSRWVGLMPKRSNIGPMKSLAPAACSPMYSAHHPRRVEAIAPPISAILQPGYAELASARFSKVTPCANREGPSQPRNPRSTATRIQN